MAQKICYAVIAVAIIAIFSGCLAQEEATGNPEDLAWEQAQKSFTVKSLESYLAAHPNGTYAAKAKTGIEDLNAASKQTARMVEGTITSINRGTNEVVIDTAMGESKVVRISNDTVLDTNKGEKKTIDDLNAGDKLRINYVNLPGGHLLAKSSKVMIGYTIAHCSCGSNCACPISRGCKTIAYK